MWIKIFNCFTLIYMHEPEGMHPLKINLSYMINQVITLIIHTLYRKFTMSKTLCVYTTITTKLLPDEYLERFNCLLFQFFLRRDVESKQ